MSLQTVLIEKIKRLPQDQQMLVKALVDELTRRSGARPRSASSNWFGVLEHTGIDISEEEISRSQRELWGDFPRENGP